jgi:hypothetical protein
MAPGRPSLVIKSGKSSTRNISVPTLLLSGVNIVSCTFHHSKSIYLHLPVNSSRTWYESLRKEKYTKQNYWRLKLGQ